MINTTDNNTTAGTQVILSVKLRDDVTATITHVNGVVYNLHWTDGGPNEWTESYVTLTAVMGRFTLLSHCADSRWQRALGRCQDEFGQALWAYLERGTDE